MTLVMHASPVHSTQQCTVTLNMQLSLVYTPQKVYNDSKLAIIANHDTACTVTRLMHALPVYTLCTSVQNMRASPVHSTLNMCALPVHSTQKCTVTLNMHASPVHRINQYIML